MRYKYRCGTDVIDVFRWNDDERPVNVYDYISDRSLNRSVREDKFGKFFTWNKTKIYLDDYIRISIKDFAERVKNKEWVTSDELCQSILSEGVDNVRFIVPFNTVCCGGWFLEGDKFKDVECKIVEEFNREVKNAYKIHLVPVVKDDTVASSRDFYVSDFCSLIQSGIIKIVT